jgi:rare lipoprotein A
LTKISVLSKGIIFVFSALLLAACASSPPRQTANTPKGGTYKVGKPYKVANTWYYPKEDPTYDRTGMASWYGPGFHGKRTANGEIYDMNDLTAAHTTLPMPSYVRVTNLENGRSMVLRVNDRGPFAKNRIIDVSRRAAQLLGFERQGTARVRVQAVAPDGSLLYQAKSAPTEIGPAVAAAPVDKVEVAALEGMANDAAPAKTELLFVQAGAFATYSNAERLARQLTGLAAVQLSLVHSGDQRLYRVRLGPLASQAKADDVLNQVLALGHDAARIVID